MNAKRPNIDGQIEAQPILRAIISHPSYSPSTLKFAGTQGPSAHGPTSHQ